MEPSDEASLEAKQSASRDFDARGKTFIKFALESYFWFGAGQVAYEDYGKTV